jgi:hypothetical protein
VALLVSEASAATTIAPIAEALLREMSTFGVMAGGQGIELERLELYAGRIAALAQVLDAAEAAANLRFGDEPFPYWYNTVKWGEQTPLAGITTDPGAPRPSELIWSMLGGWMMVMEGASHSARERLLRAVLWRSREAGLSAGLTLAADLSAAGFLLRRDDLESVLALVLAARARSASDEEVVERLLGSARPASAAEFLAAPLRRRRFSTRARRYRRLLAMTCSRS